MFFVPIIKQGWRKIPHREVMDKIAGNGIEKALRNVSEEVRTFCSQTAESRMKGKNQAVEKSVHNNSLANC